MTQIPDSRAQHYWDGQKRLAGLFSDILKLDNRPAWDVYLLYGPDAEWQQQPPEPEFWMHQLEDVYPAKQLNSPRLLHQIKQQLKLNKQNRRD